MNEPESAEQRFRTGDRVKHLPSGETWIIAWADQNDVMPCGWPETMARPSDCVLIRAATDEQHLEMLREVADADAGTRSNRCKYLLQQMREHKP